MLAMQNVKDSLQPPVDGLLSGYFPSDKGLSVVGMKKAGTANERVRVEMYCPLFILSLTS